MKKLALFFTFLFILFPAKAYAGNCNIINFTGLSNQGLQVNYINADDTSGSVTVNQSSSALLPYNTKSITSINKNISLDFSSDEVVLQGALQFVSFNDTSNGSMNPNLPNINSIPAPFIISNSNTDNRSYCEFLDTSISSNQNYVQDLGSTSTTLITPRLSHFAFTLRCYRNNNFSSTTEGYRLYFPFYFNFFPNTDLSLNTDYYVSVTLSNGYLKVSNSCSLDEIISEIQSLGSEVTEIKDIIQDTNVSGATSDFEDVLENWSYNDFSLSDFVTAPLNFIRSLANQNVCSPITLPPLLGNTSTFVLPCIMETFATEFPSLFTIYQIAIYFFVCYRIGIDLFRTVHKLKDPLNDEISVADI